ncbi:MAG: glycogen-binding domain-containing protein [Planctomycetota bacterium]
MEPEPAEELPVEPQESEPIEEFPLESAEPEPVEELPVEPQQPEPIEELPLESAEPELVEPEPMEEQTEQVEQPQTEQQEPEHQQEPTMESTNVKLADYYGVSQINEAVIFVSLYPRAGSVQIAGDFNNWQPAESPMEKVGESGVWQTKTSLPPGKYQYRLVVDGQWQKDPYNENSILNPYGEYNSVLEVN